MFGQTTFIKAVPKTQLWSLLWDKTNWDGLWDILKGLNLRLRHRLDLHRFAVPKTPDNGMENYPRLKTEDFLWGGAHL